MKKFKDIKHKIRESYVKKVEDKLKELYEETEFKYIKKIILFGSVARGDDRTSSDIDICLITDDNISNHHRCEAKYIVLDDAEYPYVDCVTIKESSFNNNSQKWKLYDYIKKEGVLIYENEAK